MTYIELLEQAQKKGLLKKNDVRTLQGLFQSYAHAAKCNAASEVAVEQILTTFLNLVLEQMQHPFAFEPYHQKITSPFDFYQLGIDFIRPLIVRERSKVLHLNHVKQMNEQLQNGDNVILLANHQTELDPQAISLMLEDTYPQLAADMIFVAGHRVVSDPMAIPFSMGRNLLCIYSKKHIEHDPDTKAEKQLHNQRTMKQMSQLLSEGGKCIYVAPSGGRDRADAQGNIQVAEFDPPSIEMFWLMAKQSGHPTHFYPLAMSTYHLLPPPGHVAKKLGEARVTQATPIFLAFGKEIDMENIPGADDGDKKAKRKKRADYILGLVKKEYEFFESRAR